MTNYHVIARLSLCVVESSHGRPTVTIPYKLCYPDTIISTFDCIVGLAVTSVTADSGVLGSIPRTKSVNSSCPASDLSLVLSVAILLEYESDGRVIAPVFKPILVHYNMSRTGD